MWKEVMGNLAGGYADECKGWAEARGVEIIGRRIVKALITELVGNGRHMVR